MPGIAKRVPPTAAGADTRDRIMSAAASAWHANSFEGIGVAEICRLAKVNKGSFFHFFASKDDLLESVLDGYAVQIGARLREGPFKRDVPPLQRVLRFFRTMIDRVRGEITESGCARGCPIGNVVVELSTRKPRIRAAASRVFDEMRAVFAEALREAVRDGSLSEQTDIESAALALLGYMQGMALLGKAYGDAAFRKGADGRILGLLGAAPAVGPRTPTRGRPRPSRPTP
jgi:TetR/AcrR family transcriptional repressor of nem operon